VFADAVAMRVGVPANAPFVPLASTIVTSSPPPVAVLPPLRVAKSVTVVPLTRPATPRYASVPTPTVPFATQVPATREYLERPKVSSAT
jgi:hypothetical protein